MTTRCCRGWSRGRAENGSYDPSSPMCGPRVPEVWRDNAVLPRLPAPGYWCSERAAAAGGTTALAGGHFYLGGGTTVRAGARVLVLRTCRRGGRHHRACRGALLPGGRNHGGRGRRVRCPARVLVCAHHQWRYDGLRRGQACQPGGSRPPRQVPGARTGMRTPPMALRRPTARTSLPALAGRTDQFTGAIIAAAGSWCADTASANLARPSNRRCRPH